MPKVEWLPEGPSIPEGGDEIFAVSNPAKGLSIALDNELPGTFPEPTGGLNVSGATSICMGSGSDAAGSATS
jgi:hypothetical protein